MKIIYNKKLYNIYNEYVGKRNAKITESVRSKR